MLVVTRYRVPEVDAPEFLERAREALQALTDRPGCRDGRVARAVDDPELWTLTTTWDAVGSYRRALSAFEVKVHAVPLLSLAVDEPSAFEDLLHWTPATGLAEGVYGRAADADTTGPGPAVP